MNLLTCQYRILGTPNEETWPGVTQLPDYKDTFPRWSKQDLKTVVPNLDEQGLDLLTVGLHVIRCLFSLMLTPSVAHFDL